MKKIICTYDDYDKYMDLFQEMNFKAMDYVPEKKELLNTIIPNLRKFIVLLMWIDETGYETEDNKECRAIIRRTLTNCLDLRESLNVSAG